MRWGHWGRTGGGWGREEGGGGINLSLPLLGGLALLAGGAYVLMQPDAPSALPEPPALPE